MPQRRRAVLAWFRNDLRTLDNAALLAAIAAAEQYGSSVWPVFCLDKSRLMPNAYSEPDGAKRADAHRVRFLLQSLVVLRARLQALGSDLLVVQAPADEALPAILFAAAADERARASDPPQSSQAVLPALVVSQDEPAWPEVEMQRKVSAALEHASLGQSLGQLQLVWGSTCFHRDDLNFAPDFADLPDSRGSFGVLVERAAHVRYPLPEPPAGSLGECNSLRSVSEELAAQGLKIGIPSDTELLGEEAAAAGCDPLSVMEFLGGEEAGLARVEEYVWENEENLAEYFKTRNGFLGRDFSSKFSPWLALGCLSPRWCYWQVVAWERGKKWLDAARQERQGVSGGRGGGKHKVWIHDEWASAPAALSTGSWGCCDQGFGECKGSYWMIFELESRDFMHYMARKHGASLFVYPAAITASEQQLEQLDAVVRHRLRLWKEGRTGVPLIDACMRELSRTGYLSNRGRMLAANFLCSDLQVPYWLGAQHFENVCIDHDGSINWGYFKGCARSFGHWAVPTQTFGGIRALPQKEQKEAGQEPQNKAENKAVDEPLAVNEPSALLSAESNAKQGMAAAVEVVGGRGGLGRAGSDLLRQCFLYDPDGTYIRTWVSEVDKMAAPWCFAPWEQVAKLHHAQDSTTSDASTTSVMQPENAANYPPPCVAVPWSVGAGKGGQEVGVAGGGGGGAPFHGFAIDRVVVSGEDGKLRFLDFDQVKIGGSLDLKKRGGQKESGGEDLKESGGEAAAKEPDGQHAVIARVAVRITSMSEGVTYGAGGLAIGITAAQDALPLTGGRCLGMAWGVCDKTVSCPRQHKARCLVSSQDTGRESSSSQSSSSQGGLVGETCTWGSKMPGQLHAHTITEGDVIGLTVTRESLVPAEEGEDGEGVLVCVKLLCNDEEVGVSLSGVHLSCNRQWFFAVSGESEAITLVRLVV